MTVFLRMLEDVDKEAGLRSAVNSFRANVPSPRIYDLHQQGFEAIPGSPFAYWAGATILDTFKKFQAFDGEKRTAKQGLATADDFRFLRLWWEHIASSPGKKKVGWKLIAKGGVYSPFYSDIYLAVNWNKRGEEVGEFSGSVIRNAEFYFRPGLTWPRRTKSRLAMRVLPSDCIFADKGPAVFAAHDDKEELLATLSICASEAFFQLVKLQLAAADARAGGAAHSFEVGIIKKCPTPPLENKRRRLAELARRAWDRRRTLDSVTECSHAFLLPPVLRTRLGDYDPPSIDAELVEIQTEIDEIAFVQYGFGETERTAALSSSGAVVEDSSDGADDSDEGEEDDGAEGIDQTDGLLSWAVGVAFGRFDWRLATGEREAPPAPGPFDPLPAKSPGMLPDGDASFHDHPGILVDDQGHPHDLPRLIEEVLARVQADVPGDVRRWLQRDFFPLHLKQYGKSRRKAPIYWPLSTSSGSYTLWLYYPSLTSQTLYTVVNDFVEPKLKQVSRDTAMLRDKGAARSRDDEKAFEALQTFEVELIELHDTLLQIAPTYRPNHDDGVQITAAPLWQLFRHTTWQKILKDTWAKLEKGDYDWAHLAKAYWPVRVREKCKTDKSLAIAHDLENLYVEPEAKLKKARGRKKAGGDE